MPQFFGCIMLQLHNFFSVQNTLPSIEDVKQRIAIKIHTPIRKLVSKPLVCSEIFFFHKQEPLRI